MRYPVAAASVVLLLALWTCPSAGHGAEERDEAESAARFSFLGPHLFPFDYGIAGLIPHDMNGDGRTDLVLMDPRRSKFQVLLQKDGPAQEQPDAEDGRLWQEEDVNELEPDRLLAKEEVRINEPLLGYVVGGFAGSEAAIAYITADRELIVDRRAEDGAWETVQRFLLELDSTFGGGFENADLDGNGRQDLVFLAENDVLILFQDDGGKLREPRRYPVAREKSFGLLLKDVNNDGRPDIVYRSPGTRYPLRVRLTQPDGAPGPEYRFRMPPARDVAVGDCTGDGRNDLALIESTTNRVKVLRWEQTRSGPVEGTETGALEMVPFPRDEKAKARAYVIADVDGDGMPDIVVTEPAAARMTLIRSQAGSGLLPAESFPSLQETSSVVAVPAPDGSVELVLCSRKEETVGVSRFDSASGRLDYPKPFDVGGTPYALAAAQDGAPGAARLYCSARGAERPDGEGPVELLTVVRDAQGYHVERRQELADLKEPPVRLVAVDADGDGRTDLLAFPEYQPPMLLVQDADGAFALVSEQPGFRKHMLRKLTAPAVDTGPPRDGERPAVFLGEGNLVRAVRFDGENLIVEDQFSSENPSSSYVALTTVDLDGDGEVEILAVDYSSKWLSVIGRNQKGVYEVRLNVEVGPFELLGLAARDVDGDGAVEVLVLGREKLGVLFLSKGGPELKEVASFETDQKETAYAGVTIADLNGDGRNELLLREIQKNQLEVLRRRPNGEWTTALRFKVFESRSFGRRDAPVHEPREAVAADLTGDALTDIAIIVHDRVIVYPQQAPDAGR